MKKNRYYSIGLMSGTSCDGLDIAYCEFNYSQGWTYSILASKFIAYTSVWKQKLGTAINLVESELLVLDNELGLYFGNEVKQFIEENKLKKIDFIASHGHTVFHQPEKGITIQIGNGEIIKSVVNLPVIYDFRKEDVANGGQGAPLVPIGDELLFSEYDYCLNVGGIANVSFNKNGIRKAYDCCFANMILNPLANKLGKEYDKNGEIARRGTVDSSLLADLMKLDFKGNSLSYELYLSQVLPILDSYEIIVEDKIATTTNYLALSIASVLDSNKLVLLTGGGAFNVYLIELIQENTSSKLVPAPKQLIEFKEALIFAFLGVLKMENIPNCLSSVTGATKDVIGGVIV